MKYIAIFIIFALINTTNVSFASKNPETVSKFIYRLWRIKAKQGANTTSYGRVFWERPYVIFPIVPDTVKSVKYNLRGLDCYTFVESTIAGQILGLSHGANDEYNADFRNIVNNLRFNGDSHEYGDQLYYASDWLYHLQKLGLADDITKKLGGVRYKKHIDFITHHTYLYTLLENHPKQLEKIKIREKLINKRIRYFIPALKFSTIAHKLKEGDIILFTSPVHGLDVGHMGFVTIKNNTPYLLEASKIYKKVTIDPLPIENYLAEHVHRFDGVIIGRLKLNTLNDPSH